jgi:signal transduction histidine kinase
MLSLRARVLLGASFWTVGLFVLTLALMAVVWVHFPTMRVLGRTGAIHVWVGHTGPLVAVAVLCMIAGIFQVRRGLSGITQLRRRLDAVQEGHEDRVSGRYVPEVQPLVDSLNALLDHREQAVRRAVGKAGDLAHGLKTPLAVVARDADRVAAAGMEDVAAAIGGQVDRMRRQIDYHLAHARAAASGAITGARCSIADSAEGLGRALARLHAERDLSFHVHVPAAHVVRVQRVDLDEMLGNLLDNACKWARTQVVVRSSDHGASLLIAVEDDGAGLAPALREVVLTRGVRADETSASSGLGLAIVRDLAEVYRGSIVLEASPLGGVRACLTLPRA